MLKYIQKTVSIVILVAFITTSVKSPAYAQSAQQGLMLRLPVPGVMVHLSPEFTPAHLQGITIHPDNALQFDFLIYRGDQVLEGEQKQEEYKKLVKYFLASLTIPDEDQWVNLSPYENNRIIKDDFGKTEMGRDLLAEDYMLKQITSSLIYPEDGLGKKFWDKVYERAWKEYHTTNIPVNTFNKVWIVPDQAIIYESGNTAYILQSHLKVMLEEDYMSLEKHSVVMVSSSTHTIGSQVIREIILPELEREVNEGKNFANLRQMYSGMVLATWYKKALKESLLGKVYADKAKVKGVDQNPKNNEEIYQRYLKAFKKGVFNYIKEDVDKYTNEAIPRKYFSGGFNRAMIVEGLDGRTHVVPTLKIYGPRDIIPQGTFNPAMLADDADLDRATISLKTNQELGTTRRGVLRGAAVIGAGVGLGLFARPSRITEPAQEGIIDEQSLNQFQDYIFKLHNGELSYTMSIEEVNNQMQISSRGFVTLYNQLRQIVTEHERSLKQDIPDIKIDDSLPIALGFMMLNTYGLVRNNPKINDEKASFEDFDRYLDGLVQVIPLIREKYPYSRKWTGRQAQQMLNEKLTKYGLGFFSPGFPQLYDDINALFDEVHKMDPQLVLNEYDIRTFGKIIIQARKSKAVLQPAGTTGMKRSNKDIAMMARTRIALVMVDQSSDLIPITLQSRNFVVLTASTIEELKEKIREYGDKIDLIITNTDKVNNQEWASPLNEILNHRRDILDHRQVPVWAFDENDSGNRGTSLIPNTVFFKNVGFYSRLGNAIDVEFPDDSDKVTRRGLIAGAVVTAGLIGAGATYLVMRDHSLQKSGPQGNISSPKEIFYKWGNTGTFNFSEILGPGGIPITFKEDNVRVSISSYREDSTYIYVKFTSIGKVAVVGYLNPVKVTSPEKSYLKGKLIPGFVKDPAQITAPTHGPTDAALVSIDKTTGLETEFQKGGIDFNAAQLSMQIKRDGKGVPLPLAQQDMAQMSRIQGFEPEIIEIKPAINVPILSELQQKLQTSST